jgi:sigma-B regulation protein RsbU (phosphoserine phosphatase)
MQISPADLGRMLRVDALSLTLGMLLLVGGLLTLVLWAVTRRRAVALPVGHAAAGAWLGIFAFLYGLRLLARTSTFRLCFDLDSSTWDYAAAAITYTIPLPIILFARVFMPSWRRFWTLGAVGMMAFATYAIASDTILRRPESASTLNNLIAIAFLAGLVGGLFRPGLTPSRELRTLRIGALFVSLTAVADNLRGIGAVAFPGPDLEPFGFTVLVACLGTVAVRRALGDARRLIVIDRELSIARQIQFSILPQAMPSVAGLTVAARYRPMTAVAGDFYDFLEIDEQRFGVLVADVAGHGVPAALIASMVKVTLAAQRERADRPAAVLAGMNEALCGRLADQYVTAAYLFIDTRLGLIRYAAAGHPPMLHSVERGREVHEVVQNGLLLGFVEGAGYQELEQPLHAGDRFLLYTDGLIEATSADEDLFGLERLKVGLAHGSDLQPNLAADKLLDTIDAWSGQPPGDDLTLVLIDWATERSSALSSP